ncbi:MAG: CPBP family intramembrane metalloprotease [Planctomycetes bacterium]|nr:CPBP family intramembrane metalloprotease [Planctomycetota bacterium]
MRGYLKPSRTLSVSLVSVLPLLAAYEVGLLLSGATVENHAGLLVKRMIRHLGFNVYAALTAAVSLAFIIALVSKLKGPERDFGGYPLIILEGALYGMMLGPFTDRLLDLWAALATPAGGRGTRFLLYMGAGVWEELVFRFALLGGLLWLSTKAMRGHPAVFGTLAVLLSAFVFAAFHHTGTWAEPLTARVFAFRLLAGGALGAIYLARGLGVCVYTHAFHNFWLLIL